MFGQGNKTSSSGDKWTREKVCFFPRKGTPTKKRRRIAAIHDVQARISSKKVSVKWNWGLRGRVKKKKDHLLREGKGGREQLLLEDLCNEKASRYGKHSRSGKTEEKSQDMDDNRPSI